MKMLEEKISTVFSNIQTTSINPELMADLEKILALLNQGKLRVAEKISGVWHTHEWIKKAILLYLKFSKSKEIAAGAAHFYDKIPLKYEHFATTDFETQGARVVPGAVVRTGAFVGERVVLMPCFVNIGAYVDSGCMVDTWATVGSCAQIGKNVHLSGGVGIGGVLEPLQASPTIIEDNCFIGARSEIVEGVIVEENSVISMGVYISQSTPIYDRAQDKIFYGRVPAGSVVVPGTLPSKNGKYHLYAAIIVKQVDGKTRAKTSINELLRDHHD